MKYLVSAILIILILAFNIGVSSLVEIKGFTPNLLLLLVVFTALEKDDKGFLFIAFVSGIYLDFFSASFFGTYTFGLVTMGFFLKIISSNLLVLRSNWKFYIGILAFSLIFINSFFWTYNMLAFKLHFIKNYETFTSVFSSLWIQYLYYLVLSYPMYLLNRVFLNIEDKFSPIPKIPRMRI